MDQSGSEIGGGGASHRHPPQKHTLKSTEYPNRNSPLKEKLTVLTYFIRCEDISLVIFRGILYGTIVCMHWATATNEWSRPSGPPPTRHFVSFDLRRLSSSTKCSRQTKSPRPASSTSPLPDSASRSLVPFLVLVASLRPQWVVGVGADYSRIDRASKVPGRRSASGAGSRQRETLNDVGGAHR